VIYNLEWNPYDVDKLVSVGVKHIKFWTLNGMQLFRVLKNNLKYIYLPNLF